MSKALRRLSDAKAEEPPRGRRLSFNGEAEKVKAMSTTVRTILGDKSVRGIPSLKSEAQDIKTMSTTTRSLWRERFERNEEDRQSSSERNRSSTPYMSKESSRVSLQDKSGTQIKSSSQKVLKLSTAARNFSHDVLAKKEKKERMKQSFLKFARDPSNEDKISNISQSLAGGKESEEPTTSKYTTSPPTPSKGRVTFEDQRRSTEAVCRPKSVKTRDSSSKAANLIKVAGYMVEIPKNQPKTTKGQTRFEEKVGHRLSLSNKLYDCLPPADGVYAKEGQP
jgi:hypothetical protein